MKRNEEYIPGEKIVENPFFFDDYAPTSLYELEKYLGFKNVRTANGREDFPVWTVNHIGHRGTDELILFEEDVFTEGDYFGGEL